MSLPFFRFNILTLVTLLSVSGIFSQDKHQDKEVIIIEKTLDQDGNVISKSIKRNQGNYSEEELNELLEQDQLPMMGSFDIEGMGFGDMAQRLFGSDEARRQNPTLGVMISDDEGEARVTDVVPSSGAAAADIRPGDKIIAIQKTPIATVEEIKEAIGTYKAGQEIVVVIWRDGSEIEKRVTLGSRQGDRLSDLWQGDGKMFFNFFGEDGSMPESLDSMMQQLRGWGSDLWDLDSSKFRESMDVDTDAWGIGTEGSKKPQLGLFVEDGKQGIIVTGIMPEGPSADAGLEIGDLILRIDDNVVATIRELKSWVNTKHLGDTAILQIDRKGKTKDISIKLD